MAGIALKGQCDLVSIMVPPEVPLKEKFNLDWIGLGSVGFFAFLEVL